MYDGSGCCAERVDGVVLGKVFSPFLAGTKEPFTVCGVGQLHRADHTDTVDLVTHRYY